MPKLIALHHEWGNDNEQLPKTGLCCSIPNEYDETLQLFEPTANECFELEQDDESAVFWGAGVHRGHYSETLFGYTDRRQIIVLLICAMHDEL